MKYRIIMTSVVILFIVGICIAYRAYTRTPLTTTPQIIIGTAAGYAPFVSIDPQGIYEGFDIDIAQNLALALGKELVLKDLGSMAPLFAALDQGSIDAIIWGLSITADRLKKVDMVRYQGNAVTAYPLIFWGEIPKMIKGIDDMHGMTICCEPATSQEAVLVQYPFITIRPTEKVDDALLNIQTGKADAALVEPAIASKFQKKYPNIHVISVPLQEKDHVLGIGIALKKGNTFLKNEINAAIQRLQNNGTIQQLAQKWGIS